MPTIISKDTVLEFPEFVLVSASAGSGKTHTLTLKILQLLLSNKVDRNDLRNILALTFTNNAAGEMRQRVLEYLKKAFFGSPDIIQQLQEILTLEAADIQLRAGRLVDELFERYSDFQIQTIDSFLSHVFRNSALELGFTPQVKVRLGDDSLLLEAFDEFIVDSTKTHDGKVLMQNLVRQMSEGQRGDAKFIWNPYDKLRTEITQLFSFLMTRIHEPQYTRENIHEFDALRKQCGDLVKTLQRIVDESGYERAQWFNEILQSIETKNYENVLEKSFSRSPIKKTGKRKKNTLGSYDEWNNRCTNAMIALNSCTQKWVELKAKSFYQPYLETLGLLKEKLETLKHKQGEISVGEVSKMLSEYLRDDIVPEVYFHLGEEIVHYLIDEFQDTSPIQWANMQPLLENALSQGGSLFIVGDTKQSIFTFRGADWRIMKNLMDHDRFLSVPTKRKELTVNYRSRRRIVEFTKEVFQHILPEKVGPEIAAASGLSIDQQKINPQFHDTGYVECISIDPSEENQERDRLIHIIRDCVNRGYAMRDIAVITSKNDTVVHVSSWLNEAGIEFISHSSLDIRKRKITGELIALMQFLDSPIDDLSFAVFLRGDIFSASQLDKHSIDCNRLDDFLLEVKNAVTPVRPLYREFQERFPELWEVSFSELFRLVGYLSLYDLAIEMIKTFRIFEILPQEEGTLVRFLEVIKDFENDGRNNLQDFLTFSADSEDSSTWTIDVPSDANAVSVMTIHKAKGLGFRVVLVLLYDARKVHGNYFIEEQGENSVLLRITKNDTEQSEYLATVYNSQRILEKVDELNKLYVVLTRAKEEMYVINVRAEKMSEPSCFFPVMGYEHEEKPKVQQLPVSKQSSTIGLHTNKKFSYIGEIRESMSWNERHRGDAIHLILSQIMYIQQNFEDQVNTICQTLMQSNASSFDMMSIKQSVVEFIRLPDVAQFYEQRENRLAFNEQEFTMHDGRLYRMDRIVIDADEVIVIDFKTGREKSDYLEQITRYREILNDIFQQKKVRCALAYVDLKIVRWIV